MEQPNFTYINNLSGGDKDFEKKLIDIIKLEFPQEKATYIENIKSNNLALAAQNVHKIKHKISILGLEKSYKKAVSFEENLKNDSKEGLEDFNSILNTITDFLGTI